MSDDMLARWRLFSGRAYLASLGAYLDLCREVNKHIHDLRKARRDVPMTYPVDPERIAACDLFRHAHGQDDLKVHGLVIVSKGIGS